MRLFYSTARWEFVIALILITYGIRIEALNYSVNCFSDFYVWGIVKSNYNYEQEYMSNKSMNIGKHF